MTKNPKWIHESITSQLCRKRWWLYEQSGNYLYLVLELHQRVYSWEILECWWQPFGVMTGPQRLSRWVCWTARKKLRRPNYFLPMTPLSRSYVTFGKIYKINPKIIWLIFLSGLYILGTLFRLPLISFCVEFLIFFIIFFHNFSNFR